MPCPMKDLPLLTEAPANNAAAGTLSQQSWHIKSVAVARSGGGSSMLSPDLSLIVMVSSNFWCRQ